MSNKAAIDELFLANCREDGIVGAVVDSGNPGYGHIMLRSIAELTPTSCGDCFFGMFLENLDGEFVMSSIVAALPENKETVLDLVERMCASIRGAA